MKLGVTHPQIELRGDLVALREFASAAEDLGYDLLAMHDYVVAPSDGGESALYSEKDPYGVGLGGFCG